jgi:hypothetical protein
MKQIVNASLALLVELRQYIHKLSMLPFALLRRRVPSSAVQPGAHPRQFHPTSFGTCLDLEELAAEASGEKVFAQVLEHTVLESFPTTL